MVSDMTSLVAPTNPACFTTNCVLARARVTQLRCTSVSVESGERCALSTEHNIHDSGDDTVATWTDQGTA
jgi:hypothetical protein